MNSEGALMLMGPAVGTPKAECGCGRLCFGSDSQWIDDGELQGLLAKAAASPKTCTALGGDGVLVYQILGRTYVDGCECDYANRVAEILWDHREEVCHYIASRAESELAKAQSSSASAVSASTLSALTKLTEVTE